jgi:dipeptidyl aminopeptidase/acylaminoacyl peptidase
MARTAPFGTWVSPVTLDVLAGTGVGLSFPMATPSHVYWTEARPREGGRQVLVRCPVEGGAREDVIAPAYNARTTVHEYGGRCAVVHHDAAAGDTVYFSNYADQRLYRTTPGGAPVPITPEPPSPRAHRYAAPVLTGDGRHLVAVRERHAQPDVPSSVENDVCLLAADGSSTPVSLLSGRDFYSHVSLAPDGRRMCWVTWDHPNMPWDGTELWEGELDLDAGCVRAARRVAGGPTESVSQPKYAPDGTLHYLTDRTGWWNLYAVPGGSEDAARDVRALAPKDVELGVPDWVFGASNYVVATDGSVLAVWSENGIQHLGVLRPGAQVFEELATGFTFLAQLSGVPAAPSALAVAGSSSLAPCIVRIAVGETAEPVVEILARSRGTAVDPSYLSVPEPVDVPTKEGEVAHALYYPPTNPDFEPPEDELPPLIVNVHGGPTTAAVPVLNYAIQYWTSRGFALVDVNYGGSSGYGRSYRERLRGQWGVVDLEDCVAAARHLTASGRADPERLLIHGGSAGGYTVLCAATFTDMFAAGASYFGVADTVVFVEETHKFESHYADGLFGPWPETADTYIARSPVQHTESLRTPLIIFQGLEDKIVPPDQAEAIVAALRRQGVPHAYVTYEGEQHGFRKAESVKRTAEAELFFYGRVLGFTPPDALEPVEIIHEERIKADRGTRLRRDST